MEKISKNTFFADRALSYRQRGDSDALIGFAGLLNLTIIGSVDSGCANRYKQPGQIERSKSAILHHPESNQPSASQASEIHCRLTNDLLSGRCPMLRVPPISSSPGSAFSVTRADLRHVRPAAQFVTSRTDRVLRRRRKKLLLGWRLAVDVPTSPVCPLLFINDEFDRRSYRAILLADTTRPSWVAFCSTGCRIATCHGDGGDMGTSVTDHWRRNSSRLRGAKVRHRHSR